VTSALYATDATRPSMVSFDLDMSTLKLMMTFSEQILPSSVTVTAVTLQYLGNSNAQSVTLTSSTFSGVWPSRVITIITLSSADAKSIKLNTQLSISTGSTFLSFTTSFATDTVGSPSDAKSSSAALWREQLERRSCEAFAFELFFEPKFFTSTACFDVQ